MRFLSTVLGFLLLVPMANADTQRFWRLHDVQLPISAIDDAAQLREAIAPLLLDNFATDTEVLPSLKVVHKHAPKGGPIVIRFAQQFDAVQVSNARLALVLSPTGRVTALSGQWAKKAPNGPWQARLSPATVAVKALELASGIHFDKNLLEEDKSLQKYRNDSQTSWFYLKRPLPNKVELDRNIRIRKYWWLDDNDVLVPAYGAEVLIRAQGQLNGQAIVIHALNGQTLSQRQLTHDASFSYRVWADNTATKWPLAGPQGDGYFPHPTGQPDGTTITLVPSVLSTLAHGPISTNDDWLSANTTRLNGNNVHAYADLVQPSGLDVAAGDHEVLVSAPGQFDFDYIFGLEPLNSQQNRNAALTHAFYVTNFVHDWLYDFGFNEAAGNGQANNYGRGGFEGDPVLVEGQDFENRNNANMTTPGDGSPGVMQLFLWDGKVTASAEVATPASLAGTYAVGHALFGPKDFDVSAQWVLYDDGITDPNEADATPHDACEAPTPENAQKLQGNIAVIDRGACFFVDKVDRAQQAGAIGVVIINHKTNETVINMGATDNPPTINIGSLMLSQADGAPIKAALQNGTIVTGRLFRDTDVDLDSALDTSLVVHEYGHFLNNRLVSFPQTQSSGIDEGLSDFLALMFLVKPEDEANIDGAFPVATYVSSGRGNDSAYFGIRRQPYSTNFAINDLTFKHIENGVPLPGTAPTAYGLDGADNAEVHATGEIWANMLWEGFVGLVKDDRYTLTEARDQMMRYHIAALMAMPNNPTFVEARDAYLAAAEAVSQADRQILLNGFAKRGLGVGAVAPDRFDDNNAGVVESFDNGIRTAPTAEAGPDQTVTEGDTVTLDGSGSSDPNGTIVSYRWIQTAGPDVNLENADQMIARFVAPDVKTTTSFRFRLEVTDNDGEVGTDIVNINVEPRIEPPPANSGGGGGGGLSWWWLSLLVLTKYYNRKACRQSQLK